MLLEQFLSNPAEYARYEHVDRWRYDPAEHRGNTRDEQVDSQIAKVADSLDSHIANLMAGPACAHVKNSRQRAPNTACWIPCIRAAVSSPTP